MQLKRLIELGNINCVLDVGANRGQFAREVRGIGFQGLIISFEPLDRVFFELQRTFRNDSRWRGFRTALGDKTGTARINVVRHLTVMSSFLETTSMWPDVDVEAVEIKRLDDMLPEITSDIECPRILLKMDTQGYDLNVFMGARGSLPHIVALQSELSVVPLYKNMPHYLEALAAYEQAGFELFNLSVESRTKDGRLQELNCLMRAPDRGIIPASYAGD